MKMNTIHTVRLHLSFSVAITLFYVCWRGSSLMVVYAKMASWFPVTTSTTVATPAASKGGPVVAEGL